VQIAWYIKGLALNYQYRYDEAINAFNEAIRLDPSYADAWNNKGLALKALGRTTEADAAFARARELGGN
jgi:Flp pilus assembly protein TadD